MAEKCPPSEPPDDGPEGVEDQVVHMLCKQELSISAGVGYGRYRHRTGYDGGGGFSRSESWVMPWWIWVGIASMVRSSTSSLITALSPPT